MGNSKYMIVHPVNNQEVLKIWELVSDQISQLVSGTTVTDLSFPKECHMTICPPFFVSYEAASALNLELSFIDIRFSKFILRLWKIGYFRNKTEDVIYLRVTCNKNVLEYVQRIRRSLEQCEEFAFRGEEFGETVNLHITICSGKKLVSIPSVRKFIRDYNQRKPPTKLKRTPIGPITSCVYARYSDGWGHLSKKPEK